MNVQKERKNLVDDLPPVDSACKLTEGLLSALYLWCTLFEIAGVHVHFDSDSRRCWQLL